MYRYVVFDVETPNRYNNRISAIGISIIEDGLITDSFFSYVNPETFFDDFNIKLTGISPATVAHMPTFPELWQTIEPIMSNGILLAHNAIFDLGVLKKCLADYEEQDAPAPFIKYLLSTILAAYRDFEERVDLVGEKLPAIETVRRAVMGRIGKFTKAEIQALCPGLGKTSVESSIKKLVDDGFLIKHGVGRSTFYTRRDAE